MKDYKFVYPEHPLHKPYREITRENDLKVINLMMVRKNEHVKDDYLVYEPKNIPPKVFLPYRLRDTDLNDIQWLPKNPWERQERIDKLFIEDYGGINLCHFDIRTRGIREGGIRLRQHARDYRFPTAFEPLAYGIGVFRNHRTEQDTSFMRCVGETPLPKINSKHLKILEHRIMSIEDYDDNDDNLVVEPKIYESTNIILADSFGELEQLHRRRKDTAFLSVYINHMRRSTEFIPINMNLSAPEGFRYIHHPYIDGWLKHVKLGIWKEPPNSTNELLERVDFLLENTLVDKNPLEVITKYEYHCYLEELNS